jgi:hypothetical protein
MTRRARPYILLLLLAASFSTGCELQQKSTPVSPTSPTVSGGGAPTSYVGTWASAVGVSSLSADKCGNFQWKITNQTDTAIAGDISATCGSLVIVATGAATLSGQNVSLAVTGTVSASGVAACNFSLTGSGTISGDTLPLAYSGTTCLGPVSGTETLKKGGGSSGQVTFDSPKPVTPIDNVVVSGTQPTLTVNNATRTGSPSAVAYRFQVSTDSSFGSSVLEWQVPEGQNQTSLVVPQALAASSTFYWRARAYEGPNEGPWGPLGRFQTPGPNSPPPPGGSGSDQIDPHSIVWLSPAVTEDIAFWPVTSNVTEVVQYGDTICVNHTKAGQWPLTDVFQDGNGANIEGRILIVAEFNGRWYGAGFDWLKEGRTCKQMPANEYGRDQVRIWPMDASWPGPRPGDRVGYLVSTPSSDRIGNRTINERSNIVVITYQ